ncbi:MAG: hypothetical protein C0601_06940 [Candidatus Muiribacterium halophilum]|uniref:Rhamnogalacturonan lyase domain-containing protein n=1 Tax=Muiribacterium halophilum TaxID=2053465 RepID=A0A2N5ZGJ0_MUIH1|nr:MAG: hypothetical protein C0601_06940 [Candidatus Muirbacterium halophilum]
MRRTYRNLLITTLIMMSMLVGCFGGNDDGGSTPIVAENPGYGILKGTLKGEDVAGALVIAEPLINGQTLTVSKVRNAVSKDAPSLIYTQADENGSFELEKVPVGDYFIQAKKGGTTIGQAMKVSVRQEARTALNIQVTATGSISGTFNMSGASTHNGVMGYLLGTSYMGISDASGAYTISNVPVGTYTMEVWAGYEYDIAQQVVSVSAGTTTSASAMTLTKPTISGNIYGKVIDQSGNAIASATVELKSGATVVSTTTSDANGDYTISGITTGSYELYASKSVLTTVYMPTVIISPERKEINAPNLVMYVATAGAATGNIEGYVVEEGTGSPIQGASVEVRLNQHVLGNVFTDATGYYSFSNITAGDYALEVYKSGYWDEGYLVTVIAGTTEVASVTELEVDNSSGSTPGNVTGQVLYYDNTPVDVATIEVMSNNNVVASYTLNGADSGMYSFTGLTPGLYTIRASKDIENENFVVFQMYSGASDVAPDIRLQNVRSGNIAGFVRNHNGLPINNAGVQFYDSTGSLYSTTNTDASGYYNLNPVNEGVYRVDCVVTGAQTQSRTVEVIIGYTNVPDFFVRPTLNSLALSQTNINTCVVKGIDLSSIFGIANYSDGSTYEVYSDLFWRVKQGTGDLERSYFYTDSHQQGTLEAKYIENGISQSAYLGFTSTWEVDVVDSTNDVGMYSSLDIGKDGRIHVAYYDNTNADLKYAYYDGTWSIPETVDSTGNVGDYCDLVVDDFDNVHIAYQDVTNANLKYALNYGAGWATENVESTADNVGLYIDIDYDTNELPVIIAQDATNSRPIVYHYDGAAWQTEPVEDVVSITGSYNSLIVSPNTHQYRIAYANESFNALNYGTLEITGLWSTKEVATFSTAPTYTDIEESDSDVYIAAYDTMAMQGFVKSTPVSSGAITDVVNAQATPVNGTYIDLELGEYDGIYVAYYDSVNGDLGYSYAQVGDTSWKYNTVYTTGDVGSYLSFKLIKKKYTVFSCYDATNTDLLVIMY